MSLSVPQLQLGDGEGGRSTVCVGEAVCTAARGASALVFILAAVSEQPRSERTRSRDITIKIYLFINSASALKYTGLLYC
jgi:hypothetical protein